MARLLHGELTEFAPSLPQRRRLAVYRRPVGALHPSLGHALASLPKHFQIVSRITGDDNPLGIDVPVPSQMGRGSSLVGAEGKNVDVTARTVNNFHAMAQRKKLLPQVAQ